MTARPNARGRATRNRGRHRHPGLPDILFHATDHQRADEARKKGVLEVAGDRWVFASTHESEAWRAAHKGGGLPLVLYLDATRASRSGTQFERNRHGLWQARAVDVEHVLNLRDGFREQFSSGGIPVWMGPDGPEVALIRAVRRFGSTWEVAKGKLETGEEPLGTAIREVQEEMGVEMDLELLRSLGFVRYGFHTPEGHPRLKTMFLYLLRTPERVESFSPAKGESIEEVAWFTPAEAARRVVHRSLKPIVRKACHLLENGLS